MITYSNPRKSYTTNDWPYGRQLRTTAKFVVEKTKQGERIVRTTVNPRNGAENKPKKTAYSARCCIVDGSDGKTYILEQAKHFSFFTIMQSNLQYEQETIHDTDARYHDFILLMDSRTD